MFTMVRRLGICFCLVLFLFTFDIFGDEVAWGGPGVSGGLGDENLAGQSC